MEFSNIGIGRSIVCALNELDYVVDAVECTDTRFKPANGYDLFIGHAGWNFRNITECLKPDTTKVYFSTGSDWKFSNERENGRVEALRRRRKTGYPFERIIKAGEDWAYDNANAIICLGNDYLLRNYDRFPAVYTLNNAAFYDDHYNRTKKGFDLARNNFSLFFRTRQRP